MVNSMHNNDISQINLVSWAFMKSSTGNVERYKWETFTCNCRSRAASFLVRTWDEIYLNPSKPSSEPFTVRTGARAYALATLLFLSRTMTFAQISSSIWVHLSRTSCIWSWNRNSPLKKCAKLCKSWSCLLSQACMYATHVHVPTKVHPRSCA